MAGEETLEKLGCMVSGGAEGWMGGEREERQTVSVWLGGHFGLVILAWQRCYWLVEELHYIMTCDIHYTLISYQIKDLAREQEAILGQKGQKQAPYHK